MHFTCILVLGALCWQLAVRCLSSIIKRSHASILKWLQRYSFLADNNIRFRTDRHAVKEIFVDETLVRIDGCNYWLWLA